MRGLQAIQCLTRRARLGRVGGCQGDDLTPGLTRAGEILLVSEEGSAGFSEGLTISADTVELVADQQAKIGLACNVSAGSIRLTSTGETTKSDALVRQGTQISADTLTVQASRTAELGQDVVVDEPRALVGEPRREDLAVLSRPGRQGCVVQRPDGGADRGPHR